jgi:hypothetical protein
MVTGGCVTHAVAPRRQTAVFLMTPLPTAGRCSTPLFAERWLTHALARGDGKIHHRSSYA